jgi:FkbM family methyltransferase
MAWPAGGLHGTYVGNKRVLVRVLGGGRVLVSADDLSLMPELVTEGGYDGPFTAFLRRTLSPDSVFVDVGANIGLFSVIGALRAWRGRVIAYEPVPALIELLRDNVQLNWLNDRVLVRPVAVAERPDRRPFAYDRRLQLLGGLATDTESTTMVDVVTLDDDLEDLERIDLVKIDVEGGEADVLVGMEKLLNSGTVSRISCEARVDAFERVGRPADWARLVDTFARMEANGWTFALIDAEGIEVPRSVDEVVASEPHPNVVARRPGLEECHE